jgi:CCR4-NOT transcription complex subunit 1
MTLKNLQVLEPCKDSKVFRPPNPWITGILSLMAEIYATDKLKLNLTFEIEMLFRNFNLQISDTRISKELSNRKRDMASNTDFTVDKALAEQSGGHLTLCLRSGQQICYHAA